MGADQYDLLIDDNIEVKVGDVWECLAEENTIFLILEVLGDEQYRYASLVYGYQGCGHLTIRRTEYSSACGKRFFEIWRKL